MGVNWGWEGPVLAVIVGIASQKKPDNIGGYLKGAPVSFQKSFCTVATDSLPVNIPRVYSWFYGLPFKMSCAA